ncbi:tryptophan-rich sensory protein [Urechidicola sp. KH5]
MIKKTLFFLILNFGALALGSYFTSEAVKDTWYVSLNKAPWTPPGWFFGFAWSVIMICFAVYMAKWATITNKKSLLIKLFTLQWILNIVWNPIFFYFENPILGLLSISLLTILVAALFISLIKQLKSYSILILPYTLWLFVATSLNAYIVLYN